MSMANYESNIANSNKNNNKYIMASLGSNSLTTLSVMT